MDETPGSPWHAVTPLRGPGDPAADRGPSGRGAERFPLVRRFRELVDADRAWLDARPPWRLRAEIGEFLHLCGRLGLSDIGVDAVRDAFARVQDLRAAPAQHRTGTEVERRALVALDRLAAVVGAPLPEEPEHTEEAFRTVPAEVVLEYAVPGEWPFDLICWNAATTLLEGVETPFLAVHRITQSAVFEPPDPYGVVAASSELRDRWWSAEADEHPGIAAEVRDLLADYVARAPHPR